MTHAPTEASLKAADLRVVLVGRTGLDDSLRTDGSVELLRARGSYDAIGELGTPIGPDSPRDAVVIVAPNTVTVDELSALTRALRRVEPGVSVVGLLDSPAARAEAPDPGRFGLDGWIVPPVSSGMLRLLSRNTLRTAPQAPAQVASIRVEPQQAPAPQPPPTTARPLEAVPSTVPVQQFEPSPIYRDTAPIKALLAGSDLVSACLAVIRSAPGWEHAAFISGPGGKPGDDTRAAADVVHNGHTFGTLLGPGEDSGGLRDRAVWLGAWLALREQHEQLRRAAFTDPLTGAWNRRYFDGFMARAVTQARESRHDLTLLLFDLNDFKHYNDRHGHAAGDEILVETVRLLRSVVRPTDRVCRLGGDEFAVVFHEPSGPRREGSHHPSDVVEATERFRAQLSGARFKRLGEEAKGRLSVSCGMATFPWDGTDAETLLACADARMMRSKEEGKRALRFGPPGDSTLR